MGENWLLPSGDDGRAERARGDGSEVAIAMSLDIAHPLVAPVPGGGVLAVGARSRWTPAGAEANAVVLDATGAEVRRFCLGDGIGHVQVTPSAMVWAGYFDEGVYGNFGWGAPSGPDPLGRAGLARWSLAGQALGLDRGASLGR